MKSEKTNRHEFSFEGGGRLTTIGATFLVSYLYHHHVDSTHNNWEKIKTQNSRISVIKNSEKYHRVWLNHIDKMGMANLNKNTMGLEASTIKKMAITILQNFKN